MSKEPAKITFTEIMKELDKYRPQNGRHYWTDEMNTLLTEARKGEKKVSWPKIAELFKKLGWGTIAPTTLQTHYQKIRLEKK